MGDLVDWFTTEIRRLGFAGLEGVYDYIASMPDDQVVEYLESLLGSEKRIVDFANSYLQRRAHGSQPNRALDSQAGSSESHGWGQTARPKSKSKRNKGKDRNVGKGPTRNQQDQKSFAKAVSNSTAAPSTRQAQAIRDAPVERMRQQVREYRKSKRPVNCIYCGKIERPVQEDGSCSFCGSPIFSVWNPSEPNQRAPRFREMREAKVVSDGPHEGKAEKPCLVAGRYVQRPRRGGDVFLQPVQYDLAGRKIGDRTSSETGKTQAGDMTLAEKDAKSESLESEKESKRNTEEYVERSKTGSASNDNLFMVQGRLLVDEWGSSASLADT